MGDKKILNIHIFHEVNSRREPKKRAKVNKRNGNRIFSLQQLQQHVEVIANHAASCKSYSDKNTVVINEQQREGLASVFTVHCNGCNEEFILHTSVKVKGPSGHLYWENNLAAVWGQRWWTCNITRNYVTT